MGACNELEWAPAVNPNDGVDIFFGERAPVKNRAYGAGNESFGGARNEIHGARNELGRRRRCKL